jgi:hypothetical protein
MQYSNIRAVLELNDRSLKFGIIPHKKLIGEGEYIALKLDEP